MVCSRGAPTRVTALVVNVFEKGHMLVRPCPRRTVIVGVMEHHASFHGQQGWLGPRGRRHRGQAVSVAATARCHSAMLACSLSTPGATGGGATWSRIGRSTWSMRVCSACRAARRALDDLDLVIRRPELLPPGIEVQSLATREYAYRTPGMREPVRVTTHAEYYEEHADSLELWSPGNSLFQPADVRAVSEGLSSHASLRDLVLNPTTVPSTET
jgi:hypothetical protein